MEAVFLTLLEVSAASAVVILAVVLLSSLINRSFTAKWKYWLWMVLAVRLLVPFNPSFESAPARVEVNIPAAPITLPAAQAVPAPPFQPTGPSVTIGISEPVSTPPPMTTVELLMLIWLCGVVLFILWQLVSYLRFRRQVERWGLPVEKDSAAAIVRQQVEAEFGIRGKIPALICGEVSSPMMIGFFCPLLILPQEEYSAQSLSYILRHELTHYKRRDIWYKALMLLANAVHWFNPAVWLMAREASRDLEISCDAAVMKNAGMEERRQYSETILSCVHRELKMKTALSTHFYGGKKALKERFANILSTKKRRAGVIAFAVVLLCGAVAGGIVAFRTVNGRTPENTARAALSDLFTVTVDKAEEFYALRVPTLPVPGEGLGIVSASEDIEKFLFRLWGNAITEDCIQRLAADRVFTRMADYVLETGRDIRFAGADITERAGAENLYDYTARMSSDNENVAQAFGTIQVEWVDDYSIWKASHITVTIKFQVEAADRVPLEEQVYIRSFYEPLSQDRIPQLICKDETGERLARAIEPLEWLGTTAEPPFFDSSHPLDADIAAKIAFDNTRRVKLDGLSGSYPEHPITLRLAQLQEQGEVPCDVIYAEDAAAALERLFGVTGWNHHTVAYYNYFPEEGIYVTYGDLIRGISYPQLLSWTGNERGYSCEVIFIDARFGTVGGQEVTEENIAELAQTVPHFIFTFDMMAVEPVVTGFAAGASSAPGPLPLSISLYEETQAGYQLWGLLIDDPEELALVASLLSTQYLTPSEDASWPDGGSPIEFEIEYEDHTVTGACNPQTINAPYRDGRYTQLRTFEDGVFYDYPAEVGNQLLAFLRSKGIDLGPWENPDTSQTEGRGYPTDRLTNLQVEIQEAFIAGLPASGLNHFHLYYEGDDIVLEIAVTDEAAVDAYLAAWTGERWDRLVKTPARVSQATLRRFAEEAQRLDFGPEVEINDISAGPYLNSDESGMNVWIVMSDYNASREEVERWAELPQQLKNLAREMGIPEDMFHYRAPVYHVPGVNYDS